VIADRHAYARAAVARLEDAEGQILDREMRVGSDVDEGTESFSHLEEIECAQVLARFVEATASEGGHHLAMFVDPMGLDPPFAPGEKSSSNAKENGCFIIEHLRRLQQVPAMLSLRERRHRGR
jgi:hypothetical protein